MGKKNRNRYVRKQNCRPTRKRFLIVCEGERTEPNYFNGFRVSKEICDVYGVGANTDSLVKRAVEIKKKSGKNYDQIWCVFDRDSFPAKNFNNAFLLAKKEGIRIAYSNEAFEIWYLLHFNYHNTANSRSQYGKMLTKRLRFKYKKNDPSLFDHLFPNQEKAIRMAEKLFSSYCNPDPEKDNPSTTVHQLVMELRKSSI